ncbi:MAG TPA: hypothetical protein VJH69_00255 [Candidatus Paceibacterota bacterium]
MFPIVREQKNNLNILNKKHRNPEDELSYLRERVRRKEMEMDAPSNRFEGDRIARREIAEYSLLPSGEVLYEAVVMPEYETIQHVLKLEREDIDFQLDALLRILTNHGIRNALSICARINHHHLKDDFYKILVRSIAEGLPSKGIMPSRIRRLGNLTLFEIEPQIFSPTDNPQGFQRMASASQALYEGLLSVVDSHENFSLEMAVPEGKKNISFYLLAPARKQIQVEQLITSMFPRTSIREHRGDYEIFNNDGEVAGSILSLARHPVVPISTYHGLRNDPIAELQASFLKTGKYSEGAAIQFIVGRPDDKYNAHFKRIFRAIVKGDDLSKALQIPETSLGETIYGIESQILHAVQRGDKTEESESGIHEDALHSIERKIKNRIAPVVIRLVASARNKTRAQQLLGNLKTPFMRHDDPNGNSIVFNDVGSAGITNFIRNFSARAAERSLAIPLSTSEIATLLHL